MAGRKKNICCRTILVTISLQGLAVWYWLVSAVPNHWIAMSWAGVYLYDLEALQVAFRKSNKTTTAGNTGSCVGRCVLHLSTFCGMYRTTRTPTVPMPKLKGICRGMGVRPLGHSWPGVLPLVNSKCTKYAGAVQTYEPSTPPRQQYHVGNMPSHTKNSVIMQCDCHSLSLSIFLHILRNPRLKSMIRM